MKSENPDGVEIQTVSAERFVEAVRRFKHEYPARAVYLSEIDSGAVQRHHRLLASNGVGGVSISPDGRLEYLFTHGSAVSGLGRALVEEAIDRGAVALDCYEGFLPEYYRQFGFQETDRVTFDPAKAPESWNPDQHGYPDVVFMQLTGEASEDRTAPTCRR